MEVIDITALSVWADIPTQEALGKRRRGAPSHMETDCHGLHFKLSQLPSSAQEAAANPFGLRALPYKTLVCSSRHLQRIISFVIQV